MSMFKKATKQESKLRLAIAGPSGSGKTYSALAIATALGGPIALLDTEHGSASKYADIFEFDVLEIAAPFHPDRFVEAIQGAAQAGYKVVILDSLTHAWNGEGGLLDIVEQIAKRMKSSNSFAAWKDATPIQNRFIEALLSADLHIIGTMRSKQEYVQERNDKGNTVIRKVGMAPIQRDGFEYEFDVFLDMDIDNNAIVSKTRCPALTGKVINKPGEQVAKVLTAWLKGAPVQAKQQDSKPVSSDVDFGMGKPTNGNGKHAENPFDADQTTDQEPEKPVASKSQINKMHALGTEFHGSKEEWNAARPVWVKKASHGDVTSSKELTPKQVDWIIASLEKRIAETKAESEAQPELEPA